MKKSLFPKKLPKIEVFIDKNDQYRFRVKAANGEVLCQSEGYTNKQKCYQGIRAMSMALAYFNADLIEVTNVLR